ncbi:heparinase II/III family protein, partial [bacterium]|nr:heparinase II/III family protein [bacterium]
MPTFPDFFITRLSFAADPSEITAAHQGSLPAIPPGNYGLHLELDCSAYPLEQHCCYMQPHRSVSFDDLDRLTFPEMQFSLEKEGVQVGPWPGWRGIPEMPDIRLHYHEDTFSGRFNFWGDEFQTQRLRIIFYLDIDPSVDRAFRLEIEDPRLRPVSIDFYQHPQFILDCKAIPRLTLSATKMPRLLFPADELPRLREKKNSSHRQRWSTIQSILKNQDLPFVVTPESKTPPGPERLHAMDLLILTAFDALLDKTASSIETAKSAFTELCRLALVPDFEPMKIDTQSGEVLFTLCIGFDWLSGFMSDTEQHEACRNLFTIADRVWAHLGYERRDFGQAHFLGCSHGLLAFSFLFWETHSRVREWGSYLVHVFKNVIDMFPADGSYPHGINLWIYEHIFIVRYLELIHQATGENLWDKTDYWKNSSSFRRQAMSPDKTHGVTFGDPQFLVSGDAWIQYLIAARTRSPEAQWLALQLAEVNPNGVDFRSVPPRRRVWEFLFFDPELAPVQPAEKKLFFTDSGQVFWREQLKGRGLLITVRAGPPLGMQRYQWGEWSGYGHSDPGNGAFLIYWGQQFLACGPGPVYRRQSRLHNVITINGHGQIGDNMVWTPEFTPAANFPRTTLAEENDDHFFSDLTFCYPEHLGLKKYRRDIIFLRPNTLLICDRLKLDEPQTIEWNLHSYLPFLANGENSLCAGPLTCTCLLPHKFTVETGKSLFVPA